jgi:hypothetical protein
MMRDVFFHRPSGLSARLRIPVFACACIFSGFGQLGAQTSSSGFTPPRAYDVTRYEAGWARNPFTLKTAPAPPAASSFAKDMVIGAYFGSSDSPTVVLVNTKTHERLRLKPGETATNGITLHSVSTGLRRSDWTVEVHGQRGEVAHLGFDENYLTQQAAKVAKSPSPVAAPQQPAGGQALPGPARQQAQAASNRTSQTMAMVGNGPAIEIPAALSGIVPPSAFAAGPEPAQADVQASPQAASQSPEQAPEQSLPALRPQRRRSITAVSSFR